ncbi:Gx transporter family protein, partial [Streptococcus thermophilus]|nr:heptaprenyl diphosphate synthase [Streptococcus thermophilus]
GAGAVLSWFGMLLIKQLGEKRVSMIGISAAGGILHNVGQLLVASLIAQSWTVMLYLPVLAFMGILAGIAVGIAANFLFEHIDILRRLRYDRTKRRKKG